MPNFKKFHVGQMFVPFGVGVDGYRQIYRSMAEVVSNKEMNMSNVTLKLPFYANITHPSLFDAFIFEVLNFFANNGRLGVSDAWAEEDKATEAWMLIDEGTAIQYEKIQEMNSMFWKNLSEESYDKEKFTDIMIELKESFVSSAPPLERQNYERVYKSFITNIDQYYSLLPTLYLSKRYGLGFDAEICTFLPSQEYVKISDLPLDLQDNIDGLQLQTLNGQECLEGWYVFGFDLHDTNDYTLKLIRVKDFLDIKQVITKGNRCVGYPCEIHSMFPGPT